jgi:hypothetical protein
LTYIKEAVREQEFNAGDIVYFIGNDEYDKGACEIDRDMSADDIPIIYKIKLRTNRFWVTEDYLQSTPGGNKKQPEKKAATIRWYNKGKLGEREISKVPEYDDFIIDNVFRDFLINHGCYDSYIKNVEKFNPNYKIFFINDDRKQYLNHCFTWSNTGKEKYFWEDLHCEWKEYLKR